MARLNLSRPRREAPSAQPTPLELGYRMPAEWEPHEATWLAWPHERTDWPGKFAPIPWVYAEVVRHLARVERVRILVQDREEQKKARRILAASGADLAAVDFFVVPTNRGWTRDFGPIFIKQGSPPRRGTPACAPPRTPRSLSHSASSQPETGVIPRSPGRPRNPSSLFGIALTHWRFNAWAKYDDWQKDNAATKRLIPKLKLPVWEPRYRGRPVVLEGGSIDVNGRGTLLTTEECMLSPVQARNPGVGRADLEKIFRDYLGVTNVLWLGRGIAGDDTHGHIDDLARFVNPSTVLAVLEKDPSDANYQPLQENLGRLRTMKNQDGKPLQVKTLPMPEPVYFHGQRLPASYANFYIANGLVLVPTFNDASDRIALDTLARLFPDRKIIGIACRDLVLGLGTLHCMTQQQPTEST
jgi:agmatine deiminase